MTSELKACHSLIERGMKSKLKFSEILIIALGVLTIIFLKVTGQSLFELVPAVVGICGLLLFIVNHRDNLD